MKNIFKFFSVMLVAGAMLCSCTDPNSDDPNNPTTPKYNITVTANNDAYGTVTGSGEYDSNTVATLTATPNAGYTFTGWNDGVTNNPRLVTVTKDEQFIANFEEERGVKVTFGTTTWEAGYVNAQLATNGVLLSCGQTDATTYPIIQMLYLPESGSITTGTVTGNLVLTYDEAAGSVYFDFGNPYLWYFESNNIAFNSGTVAGDWMSKTATLNITALDLNAMTGSMTANATMAHMTDILTPEGMTSIDVNDCETRDLTVTVTNLEFSPATKAMNARKATLKVK